MTYFKPFNNQYFFDMLTGDSKNQPLSQILPALSQASTSPSQLQPSTNVPTFHQCPSNCIKPVQNPVILSKYTEELLSNLSTMDLQKLASTFSLTTSGNKSILIHRILTFGISDRPQYNENDVDTYPKNHLLIIADELLVSRKPVSSLQSAPY